MFMQENAGKYPVTKMAETLKVSRASYYKWKDNPERKQREEAEEALVKEIKEISEEHKMRYGYERIRAELMRRGRTVSRKKVCKLVRKHGLNARKQRKFIPTTNSNHGFAVSKNILNRQFAASKPGTKWVSDITYIRTRNGWLYLTIVLDLFDRKIIGWAVSTDMEALHTVVPAFTMACLHRKPKEALIFHSDRGVQYCSTVFRDTLQSVKKNIQQSMSRKGNCWDNACAESFFKTLKRELETLDGNHMPGEVRASLFEYIEVYYNRKRLHSVLGYLTPTEAALRIVA